MAKSKKKKYVGRDVLRVKIIQGVTKAGKRVDRRKKKDAEACDQKPDAEEPETD